MKKNSSLVASFIFLFVFYNAYARGDTQDVVAQAQSGDKDAQYELGVMLSTGQGFTQDDMQAVMWYRKAAEQGVVKAKYNLGWMYENGRGVKQDNEQAMIWYLDAAKQGNAVAQSTVAGKYMMGLGVIKDYSKAATWYQKAAEQGESEAQYNLGTMYFNGQGVTQDDTKAINLFRKAAEQGLSNAQFGLGWMYENSRGVIGDRAQAIAWYKKAADQGNLDAKERLNASPKKQWWIVDGSRTECFENEGPAAKLDEFVGFSDRPYTKDYTNSYGEIIKVEVINENNSGQEIVWTYYKNKQTCEAEQINSTKSLAEKYR